MWKNCSSNFLITLLRRISIAVWIGRATWDFTAGLLSPAVNCYWGEQTPSFPLAALQAPVSVRQVRAAHWHTDYFLQLQFSALPANWSNSCTQGLTGTDAMKRLGSPTKREQRGRRPHPPAAAAQSQSSVHISWNHTVNWSMFKWPGIKHQGFVFVQTDPNCFFAIFHPSIVNFTFSASLN